MSEWQPIETAPKDGTRIIAIQENDLDCVYVAKWDDYMGWTIHDSEQFTYISHWMPLPEPPKKKHCCFDYPLTISCTDALNGPGLIVVTHESWFKVSYCPFCGEKADE